MLILHNTKYKGDIDQNIPTVFASSLKYNCNHTLAFLLWFPGHGNKFYVTMG